MSIEKTEKFKKNIFIVVLDNLPGGGIDNFLNLQGVFYEKNICRIGCIFDAVRGGCFCKK